jgi:Helix-turn-helix.
MDFGCLFLISVLLSFRERGDDVKSQYERISSPSERLKEALDIREMKAAELSERSGINKPSISCYLSGRYEPKQEALYKMGRVLDVAEMWLAGYDIPMERPKSQKNNDAISDIVVKLRTDDKFLSAVKKIYDFAPEKLESFLRLLD